jgi:hypothetical protein
MIIEQYDLPIGGADLRRLEEMLEREGLFTPTFAADPPSLQYRALTYRRAFANQRTTFILLPDRNLVSRWIEILDGRLATSQHRLAAAVMAFAQCANALVEPNLALYEVAHTRGQAAAEQDHERFRIADNLPTRGWTDLALGRIEQMSESYIKQAVVPGRVEPDVDFSMPLRRWRRNYILALKLADLELEGGNPEERMLHLISWMHRDFLLGGPAILLAAHYLAPNSNRDGLIYGLRSQTRTRAIEGLRNVAWDLTYLSELLRREEEHDINEEVVVFATLDQGLRRIATSLVLPADADPNQIPSPESPFLSLWGTTAGQRIASHLAQVQSQSSDPTRQLNREVTPAFIDDLIAALEHRILEWSST